MSPPKARTKRRFCALEAKSEHPLAAAVMECAGEKGIRAEEVKDFEALPGNGLRAVLNGKELLGGSGSYMKRRVKISSALLEKSERMAELGKTPLFFAYDGALLGIIAVADVIKPDSAQAVRELKNLGVTVMMLTGDNERTANAIGREAGVDKVIAGVLPDGKEKVIRDLREFGKVAMVGSPSAPGPILRWTQPTWCSCTGAFWTSPPPYASAGQPCAISMKTCSGPFSIMPYVFLLPRAPSSALA